MDKISKKEQNNFLINSLSILKPNKNVSGISYENYMNAKNKLNFNSLENSSANNITIPRSQNKFFPMNMNLLYTNMFRYSIFKNAFLQNQFQNNRINSFKKNLKNNNEKEELNFNKGNKEEKNTIYNFTPLIQKLESQEDERFTKSRFLKFIKDVNSNKLIINEEKNIIEENPNYKNEIKKEKSEQDININELEELLKEAKKYMDYSREDLAIDILEKILDDSLIKLEKNKEYLEKVYIYLIICYLNINEVLIGISFIIDLLFLIKIENNEEVILYNKKYIEKEFINKINRRDFNVDNNNEYEDYENNIKKIKEETENYIKSKIMINKDERYNEMLLVMYGLISYLNENYIEAEGAFNQLIILNEQNYFYFNTLGVINSVQNKYEEAMKYYKKALEINNEYPKCLINIGILYSNQGKYKESCKYIISALKIFEDIPEGWNNILSNVIELDEDDLICAINERNLVNIEKNFV